MADLHIPEYCGISGCWNEAKVSGYDEKNHPVKACCEEHKQTLIAYRHQIYLPHDPIPWQGVIYGLRGKFAA